MRDDYKLHGALVKIEFEIEKDVYEKVLEMEKHSKLSSAEITNTALKRFISGHKDFFPPKMDSKTA